MTTRTRNRSIISPTRLCKFNIQRFYAQTSVLSTSNSGIGHEGPDITEVMIDNVTSGYEKLSAQGRIINNPMTQTKTITYDPILTSTYADVYYSAPNTIGYRIDGDAPASSFLGSVVSSAYYAPLPITDFDIDHLEQLAITQAWANIDQSQALIGATIAEGKKTILSLISIFKRAFTIFKAVKRLDLKALRGEIQPRELADRYMEARYAIRPVVYDAAQILGAITCDRKAPPRQTFRGTASDSKVNTTSGTILRHPHGALDYFSVSSVTCQVRAGVLVQADVASELTIWGVTHPLETVWELIPFSFIADWFFNIGQTLASWTPEAGIRPLSSWSTIIQTNTRSISTNNARIINFNPAVPVNVWYDAAPITMSYTTISKERKIIAQRSTLPTYKVRLDGFKLLDLAIIMRKLMSSR